MKMVNQGIILAICYAMLFLLCLWVWRMKAKTLYLKKY